MKIGVTSEDEDEYFISRVIGCVRLTAALSVELIGRRRATGRHKDSTKRIFEYLVEWHGYPMDESTW